MKKGGVEIALMGGMAMQELLAKIGLNAAISVALPYPPSVNSMYFNAASGRVSSQAYQKWRRECASLLKDLSGKVEGEYLALILVNRKNKNADIDNRIKASLDVLVKNRITGDDSNCRTVCASWLPKAKECQVYIYLFTNTEGFSTSLTSFFTNQNLNHTYNDMERIAHKPNFKLNLNLKLTKEKQNGLRIASQ